MTNWVTRWKDVRIISSWPPLVNVSSVQDLSMPFPSDEQRAVIEHRGRPLVVVAGPGTGKTRTLVARMIGLLAEDQSREVSFITFTRTSRSDTRARLESALGGTVLQQPQLVSPRSSTLHTYAKSLVHRYAAVIGRESNFSVLIEDKGEKDLLLDELLQDLGLDTNNHSLCKGLTCFRSTGAWPPGLEVPLAERYRIVEHYEQLLCFYNTFDMEGLVLSASIILTDAADALPPLYLQVDEYQDLNPMDQRLVKLAASHPHSQVVVVADDAQSIYGFRHANFQGVRVLWDSPDWDGGRFPDCHRLPAHVLNAAQALIADQGYLGALNPKPDDGRRILTLRCTTSELQIEAVAQHVHRLKSTRENRDGEPLAYGDFLVLCPTNNLVSHTAQALGDRFDVPARTPTKASIPDDLWRLLLVLRMLHFQDSLALRQWLPLVGFSEEETTAIRRDAMNKGRSLYTYGAERSDPRVVQVYSAIERLRDSLTNIGTFVQVIYEFPGLSVREDVLLDVVSLLEMEDGAPPSAGWLIHSIYEKFGLVESEPDVPDEDSVLVTTLHRAKGLEAEYAFCVWLNASFMPMAGRDVAEERRVLYVALTRAKMDVILTFYEVFDTINECLLRNEAMSPFLHEIRDHLAIDRVTARDLR